MAAGDLTLFRSFLLGLGTKTFNLSSDTVKMGLVTAVTTPTNTTADPCWGAGGSTNFATNAVATGTGYTGPLTITSASWTSVANVPTFQGTLALIPQDAAGFANARWGIIYDDTAANKNCIGFIDLGATVSIQAASYQITFNGGTNVFTLS